jgi:hypothetical protein
VVSQAPGFLPSDFAKLECHVSPLWKISSPSFLPWKKNTLTGADIQESLLGKCRSQKKAQERESQVQQAKVNDRLKLPGCPGERCSSWLWGREVFMYTLYERTRKWVMWKIYWGRWDGKLSVEQGISGAYLLKIGGCFLWGVFSRTRGVVLSLTGGHNGDQNGDPAGSKVEALLSTYFY